MKSLAHITLDPAVMRGKLYIRGLCVTVGDRSGFPRRRAFRCKDSGCLSVFGLEEEDIREALAYAAWRAEEFESLISRSTRRS